MKSLILAVAALASASVAAGEFTSFGTIYFKQASTFVRANEVCRVGTTFLHKTADAWPVEHCPGDSRNGCETEYRPLVQPMVDTKVTCASQQGNSMCRGEKVVPFIQLGGVPVDVYASYKDFEKGRAPKRSFIYEIPACANEGYTAY